jgi:hypothetical protein
VVVSTAVTGNRKNMVTISSDNIVTIYAHKIIGQIRVKKSGHDLIPKSQLGFQKWTKINVQK